MNIRIIIIGFAIMSVAVSQAQEPMRLEYYMDSDPGYGQGYIISNVHVGNNQLSFDVSEASPGAHMLSIRVQDSDGHWTTTMNRPLFIDRLQNIVYVEYFIDIDPGTGHGVSLSLPDTNYKAHLEFDFGVNTSGLSIGEHVLFIRALDALGQWTELMSRRFTIYEKGEPSVDNLRRIEYFFDADPGYGKGFPLLNPRTGENTYIMSFESTVPGYHLLSIRAQDEAGCWSQTLSRPIYVVNPVAVKKMEYFFDTDPGDGKATTINVANASSPFAFEIPVTGLPVGAHKLYIRAMGSDGLWCSPQYADFEVSIQTGIDDISDARDANTTVYSISGQRTQAIQKGIYIINGKKIMIK